MKRIRRTQEGLQLDFERGEAELLRALPARFRESGKPAQYADDAETNAELRQLMDADLRARREARAGEFMEALSSLRNNRLVLTDEQAEHWLAVLTDLRVILAERVGVHDERWGRSVDVRNPPSQEAALYIYLTSLQGALLAHGFGVEQDPTWR